MGFVTWLVKSLKMYQSALVMSASGSSTQLRDINHIKSF